MSGVCNVCCSNYNKSLHAEIKCYFPSCAYSACKECVRTYLTGITAEPHCMKCRNKWSLEFTKTSLNASFMETDYKNHRQVVLADRVIAQIPEFYEGALRYGQLTESDLKLKAILMQISEHRTIIGQLYLEYDTVRREMDNKGPSESKKFVMQCQNDGCRGMLTTQYKCDICTKFTCPKCFLAILGEKADHECKQEDIDTVEELRKNTRPCPNCGLRISKIDGCDQMWCIECKTAFSWAKGTVEKGVVHNPHYYQWMRQNGGVPRNPNEHNDGCANVFGVTSRRISEILYEYQQNKRYYTLFCDFFAERQVNDEKLKEIFDKSQTMIENIKLIHPDIRVFDKFFSGFHRYINHMEHTQMRPLLANIRTREQDKTAIYQYILNKIDKTQLSEELIRYDNLNMKDQAHCDILEALVVVGKQIMIDCMNELQSVVKDYPFVSYIDSKMNIHNIERVSFLKNFATHHIFFLPHEVENYLKKLHAILTKYKNAISKYCAYSNIESIKFLITYGSKKTLVLWNYFDGCVDNMQFKTKAEMIQHISQYQAFYESCSESNEIVENEIVENEIVENEIVENEIVENEIVENEIVENTFV
jgi:hypothetical protein